MSAYKTIQLSRTGDGDIIFDSSVTRWKMDSYPANAQISVADLPVGATFDVSLRPAGHVEFKEHILASGADDLVMLAGKEAPLFSALKISISNSGGAEVTAFLTLWERGI
jgi:hypothetical protein